MTYQKGVRPPYHNSKPGRSFGGGAGGGGGFQKRSFGGGGGGSFGPPQLFKARCAECGDPCEVPFKPNGKKPVLCSRCFKKDDGASGFKKPWERDNNGPSNFTPRERPSFGAPRPGAEAGMSKEQFKTLNTKLDQIIEILEDLGIAEEEETAA